MLSKQKLKIARNFSRAASTYDQVSVLQQEVGLRLLERLDLIKLQPTTILDLGSGTGSLSKILSQKYPEAIVLNTDIATGMIHFAQMTHASDNQRYLCGDGDDLPIKTHSIDFAFSNCALHWFLTPETVFKEIDRILKPKGLFLFSTFGPDTLKELRQCFKMLDQEGSVNLFIDMHHMGDMLLQEKFLDPVMDMEIITLTYKNAIELIRDLKLTGSHTVNTPKTKPQGLLTASRLNQFLKCYEKDRNAEQRLPATFEVIYGHAWSGKSSTIHNQTIPCTVEF